MGKQTWEVRTNGIRSNGMTFGSFSDAEHSLCRVISGAMIRLQRDKHPGAERAGEAERAFYALLDRLEKQRPLPDRVVLVLPSPHDYAKNCSYELARLPWRETQPHRVSHLDYVR